MVYGAVGNVSIAGLFMAGVVPGLMIGFGLMIYCYFFGPSGMRKPRAPFRQVVFAAGDAALPLMIPVILLGGILTGWFTPTEAGVVAVIWIIAIVIPALNRGHIKRIPYDFCLAGLIFSLPLITIGAANAFGWMLAYLRGAIVIADWITSIAGNDPHYIMLLLVLLFTIVGDFIEPVPTIIIFMPLVNALTQAGDINGVHMGVVLIATLAFGLITPPYGLVLLMASKFVGVSFAKALRAALPIYRGVSGHHHLHHLFSERGAVAAQACHSGIGRLLQVAGRNGVYLPQLNRRLGRWPARRAVYFALLVNFLTATRKSSVCMQSMMASRSASSCCSIVVMCARWISAFVAASPAAAFCASRRANSAVADFNSVAGTTFATSPHS